MDMQKILEYRNARNRFCQRIGITVTELSPGYAKVVKTVTEDDLNPVDVAHGGLFFSMADNAAGSAMAAYGEQAVTLNAQYNFMRAAKAGDVLTAEAREAKHGGTVCVFDIRITDQDGNLDGTFRPPEPKLETDVPQSGNGPGVQAAEGELPDLNEISDSGKSRRRADIAYEEPLAQPE